MIKSGDSISSVFMTSNLKLTMSLAKGTISGTAQGMGAAKKGGKYHWVGPNDTKW